MVEATINIGDFEHVREGISLFPLYGTLSGPLKTRALVYSSYIKANSGAAMIQIILHRHQSSAFHGCGNRVMCIAKNPKPDTKCR